MVPPVHPIPPPMIKRRMGQYNEAQYSLIAYIDSIEDIAER